MVELTTMMCRKNSEQENQNRTEPKMMKEEAFFFGYVDKAGF